MAGHNKWSKVKRLKGALDSKRGTLISKLAREITLATETGDGSPIGNTRSRSALQAALLFSMPIGTIERAVKPGVGEAADAVATNETIDEGDSPRGRALVIEASIDNRNRIGQVPCGVFSRNGGILPTRGDVLFQFEHKGQLTVGNNSVGEDCLLEIALDAGADDVSADEDHHLIITPHDQLDSVGDSLKRAGLEPDSIKLTYLPENTLPLTDEAAAAQFLQLSEALEDNDDVENAHGHADIPEALLVKIGG